MAGVTVLAPTGNNLTTAVLQIGPVGSTAAQFPGCGATVIAGQPK